MSLLLIENRGAVRTVTLNRPDKKNAVNEPLAAELADALATAAVDRSVKVVVLAGKGSVFCAGADVSVFLEIGRTGKGPEAFVQIHEHLRAFPKPLIAGVHGLAVGMGVTLLPHFDMVYASESARFHLPFAQLGLVVEYGSSFTLPRLIGRQRANELALRGKPISADTAAEWGLVTRVFPDAMFHEEVYGIAQDVAALPTGAIQRSKSLLQSGEQSSLGQAIERENAALEECYGSEENVKAVEAFLGRKGASRS